jgi:uncharacterized protein
MKWEAMTKTFAMGVAGALVATAMAVGATRVTIGTGPWSGVYFLVGAALADLLNKHVGGVTAVPEPVAGSAHALELVDAGSLTIAIVDLATAHFGVRGERGFERKHDNVGFVMAAMDTGQTLVTRAGSGIKTFADVKGLRVAANSSASEAQLLAALTLYGVKAADFRLRLMNYAEQIAALKEGTIDAGFLAVGPRNPDVADLASALPIQILGFDAARATMFAAQAYWTSLVIKARTYRGQDRDLIVPGVHTTLLANKQADADLVYHIVKTVIDYRREFEERHPGGNAFTIEKTRYLVENNLVPVTFHPGAERYWKEKGVLR